MRDPAHAAPGIDRIAFTGGPETARHVVRNSAENFAVTSLELSGKSPILVFDDADLDGAANGLIAGNFGASGQSCVAGSRGIVHRSILEPLASAMEAKMKDVVIGDPLNAKTHVGPLCTKAQTETIRTTLSKSVSQGARIRLADLHSIERETTWNRPLWNVQCQIPRRSRSKCSAKSCRFCLSSAKKKQLHWQ